MSMSVDGSRIHRSLVKKIWWNMMKYFEKSVEMMAARIAVMPKNRPVPRQTDFGNTRLKSAFSRNRMMTPESHKKQAAAADGERI